MARDEWTFTVYNEWSKADLESQLKLKQKDWIEACKEIDRLKVALSSIVALTHSWLITEETAPCKPTFDKIREVAETVLRE